MNHGIGYQFKIINDRIRVKADADLRQHDLTLTQTRVMGFLTEAGGRATQKEIEEDLQVSHPTVVGIVSRMEQKGFLQTWTDPMDRRNKLVCLTDKARQVDQEIDATVEKQDQMLLRGLSEQQVDELRGYLALIIRNLEQE